MKRRKPPVRMCASCGEKKMKKEMTRVVRTPDGNIKIDEIGKVSGRGAYICKNADCVTLAKKRRIIERNLLSAGSGKRDKGKAAAGEPAEAAANAENKAEAGAGGQDARAAFDPAQIEALYKSLYELCEANE